MLPTEQNHLMDFYQHAHSEDKSIELLFTRRDLAGGLDYLPKPICDAGKEVLSFLQIRKVTLQTLTTNGTFLEIVGVLHKVADTPDDTDLNSELRILCRRKQGSHEWGIALTVNNHMVILQPFGHTGDVSVKLKALFKHMKS